MEQKDKYFAINTFAISAVEVLWGIGLPLIVESTFLQLFLKSLGASNQVIGLVPAVMGSGIALFSIMSAYYTTHLAHKRRVVILFHILTSIPIFIFGVILFIVGKTPDSVYLFLLFYTLGSFGLGLTIPLWQNFLVKIFSERNTIPALSIMFICQTLAKLAGSLVIVKIVGRFSFSPESAAVVFMCLGALFFAGSFFFLFVMEINSGEDLMEKSAHNVKTLTAAVFGIVKNRNFMLFLLASTEAFTCITIISFYANYAVEYYAIPRSLAAGLFVAVIYGAGIVIQIIFGWFNLLTLKNKLILSRIFALSAVGFLLAARSLPLFLVTSALLGGSRAITAVCFSPAIKKLSGVSDATDYFAVSQFITLPMSFGIPFLSGLFLDGFAGLGVLSYKIVFVAAGVLVLASLFFVILIDFGGENAANATGSGGQR
jgi:hypothetical protein